MGEEIFDVDEEEVNPGINRNFLSIKTKKQTL